MKEILGNIANVLNQYRNSHHIPGFAASIVSDGNIIYKQGFGTGDAENPYARVTPETQFPIMDITKSFTALALVHLEETTEFNLDTPIVDYLPYFRTKNGAFNKITTTHILSHTAGFPENISIVPLLDKQWYKFFRTMPEYQYIFEQIPDNEKLLATLKTRADVTRYFATISLEYEPGESWNYCTDAYVIGADILEKLSGMYWEEYVTKYLIRPMQLEQTDINPTFDDPAGKATKYYMKGIADPMQVPAPRNQLGAPVGFMYSTAHDMAVYLMNLMNHQDKVLSAAGLAKMHAPIAKREAGISYGLGWETKQFNGLKVVEHAGGYPGVSSFVSMIPDRKFGLTLLCNMDTINLGKLANRITRTLLAGK